MRVLCTLCLVFAVVSLSVWGTRVQASSLDQVRMYGIYPTGSGSDRAMKAIASAFNAHTNRSFDVRMYAFGMPNVLSDYIPWVTGVGSPDVIPWYPRGGGYTVLNADHYLPLQDVWDELDLASDLPVAAIEACKDPVSGDVFAVPLVAEIQMCVYRRSFFKSQGLQAPPSTWSGLLSICSQFASAGIRCLASDFDRYPASAALDYLIIRMQGNEYYGRFFDGHIPFTDPPLMESLTEYRKLIDSGYFSASSTTGKMAESSTLVTNETAIYCGNGAASGRLVGVFGVPDDDLVAFAFPDYDGPLGLARGASPPVPTNAVLAVLSTLAIPKNALYLDHAKEFIRFAALNSTMRDATMPSLRSGFPMRSSLRPLITSKRAQLGAELMAAVPGRIPQVSRSAFQVAEVATAWGSFVDRYNLEPDPVAAAALLQEEIPRVEALRVELVLGRTATPIATPEQGTYQEGVVVTLTCLTPESEIYYTLDGAEPSVSSTLFTGPFAIEKEGETQVRAFAVAFGVRPSEELQTTYLVVVQAPATASDSGLSAGALAAALGVPLVCLGLLAVGLIVWYMRVRKRNVLSLTSDDDLVIDASEITLGKQIGEGSYGTVFVAKWRAMKVAVKRTGRMVSKSSRKELKTFVDEAGMLLRLRHPNIVIFMGITLNPPSIVTEFMQRGSMYEVLHSSKWQLDATIVKKWAHNCAQGLRYLTHAGVIHGDFKSLNVLFDNNWVPKICDFGMSSLKPNLTATVGGDQLGASGGAPSRSASRNQIAPSGSSFSLNMSARTSGTSADRDRAHALSGGANVGTLFWASPELLTRGSNALSSASDAFALGITLWELATRGHLYPGENPLAVALQVVEGRRPPVGQVPPELTQLAPVMQRLWEADIVQRMSLDEATEALGELYVPELVVYPSTASVPTGESIVIHAEMAGALEALLGAQAPRDTVEAQMRAFHATVLRVSAKQDVAVIEWGVGWATLVTSEFNSCYSVFQAFASPECDMGPVRVIACSGKLLTTHADGERTFAGPVLDGVRQMWEALWGSFRFESLTAGDLDGRAAPLGALEGGVVGTSVCVSAAVASRLSPFVDEDPGTEMVGLPAGVDAGAGAGTGGEEQGTEGTEEGVQQVVFSGQSGVQMRSGTQTEVVLDRDDRSASASVSSSSMCESGGEPTGTHNLALQMLPGDAVQRMTSRATGEMWMGSHARAYPTHLENTPAVLKTLLRQDMSADEMVTFVATVAAAARVQSTRCAGPIAICLEAPFRAVVHRRVSGGSLQDVMNAMGTEGMGKKHRSVAAGASSRTAALSALHSLTSVRRLVIGMFESVEELHGIVGAGHGALRPSNVFPVPASDGQCTVVLTDFGMEPVKTNMGTMTMVPTVGYSSPEDLTGAIGHPAGDIFVLGTILYELFSGQAAFEGRNALEVCFRITTGYRPELNEAVIPPREIREVIAACWADLEERPSISEILRMLRSFPEEAFTLPRFVRASDQVLGEVWHV